MHEKSDVEHTIIHVVKSMCKQRAYFHSEQKLSLF